MDTAPLGVEAPPAPVLLCSDSGQPNGAIAVQKNSEVLECLRDRDRSDTSFSSSWVRRWRLSYGGQHVGFPGLIAT